MANRSYIYGLINDKYYSIGEYPYFIPYAYRILAAYDNKIVDSHLFDKIVGIEADFLRGKEALYWLLDFLVEGGQMKDPDDFKNAVIATKKFIDAITAEQILLENGELYALYTNEDDTYLDGPGLEKVNGYAREDYQWIGEDIDNIKKLNLAPHRFFNLEETEKLWKWLADLKDTWKEKLGLDSWRKILYFQFTDDPNALPDEARMKPFDFDEKAS